MALVLDAGAFLAIERGDKAVLGLILAAQRSGIPVRTSSTVVSQVWRGGSRQARLARTLRGIDEVEHDQSRSRAVGELLGRSRTTDVVDAALIDLTVDGDDVVTSDIGDLRALARVNGRDINFIPT